MKKSKLDVFIIGDGPAAATVALILVRSGISVTLIGLPYSNNILFGETLTPDIKTYLVQLGIWNDFLNDEHLQSSGNLSSWGEKNIRENNFIYHPNTYGWHIDRLKFNQMCVNAAKREGALYLNSKIESVNKNCDNTFNIKLRKSNNSKTDFSADFIVDATGRARWFSSSQGILSWAFDNLCGYVCFLSPRIKGDGDSMTLIESVPNGWWYSALLPKNIRVISFFTNYNLPISKFVKTIEGWKKMIQDTDYIKAIINKYNYNIISGPHIMISNSTRLEKVIGTNWLAVGDAAITFDPLSSNGILTAIRDSISASDTIRKYLKGKDRDLEEYNKRIITNFTDYIKKRYYYYNLEKRWSNNDFWKQNQPTQRF
jgi:flavin-dependent dehydrogenase